MATTSEMTNILESVARKRIEGRRDRAPVTQKQLIAIVRQILTRAEARGANGAQSFSLARMVRGLAAIKHVPIVLQTAEGDAEYVKTLATTGAPGQYLVPTITTQEIIEQLAQFETFRAAGARIWPMEGVQKMTVPVGVSAPAFVWTVENSQQTPSDPNFAAINFALKNLQSLELAPMQLFASTRPEFDVLLESIYAEALADSADSAMHASSTLTNAPTALMAESGTTKINVGGSANGGNLAYSDLLGVLQKASDLKAKGSFCWIMAGRSWLRVLSLAGTTSNPFVQPGIAVAPSVGFLLGYPVYTTASISVAETLGSGSSQSHIVFCPPRAVHIGENAEIVISLSDQFAFDANQIAIRINRYTDWDFQPAAALIILLGVN